MPVTRPAPWYVHHATYGADLRTTADEATVTRIVDAMIDGTFFDQPVADYHEAYQAALRSPDELAFPGQDEQAVRDLLTRVITALDARRPWPGRPYQELGGDRWALLRHAPIAARLAYSKQEVAARLHRAFIEVETDAGPRPALILRLRTGQELALLAPEDFRVPGVDLLTREDPGRTLAAFEELTGLTARHV